MKRTIPFIVSSFAFLGSLCAEELTAQPRQPAIDPTTTILFDKPASTFFESLPLGNGRIGAMVFGGVSEERIVLNESSVWSGSPNDDNRPNAHESLPEIRRLLAEGKNVEAEDLVDKTFTCQGAGSGRGRGANVPFGSYQVQGNLHLKFADSATPPQDYTRSLEKKNEKEAEIIEFSQ